VTPPKQTSSPGPPTAVASIIDDAPLSRYQWRVAGLCLLVGIVDGFENGAIAYVAPALAEDLSIPLGDIGKIFPAGTFGMAIGAMLLGNIADLWEHKRAILLSVGIFGVAAKAAAAAESMTTLMIWRFVAGITIGGAQPVMVALLAEYSPAFRDRLRGAHQRTAYLCRGPRTWLAGDIYYWRRGCPC